MADMRFDKVMDVTIPTHITWTMSGEEKVASFIRTLQNVAKGTELNKYWKSQRDMVLSLVDAMKKFNKESSKTNATEVVNATNALKGLVGSDISMFFKDWESAANVINSATSMVGKSVGDYTVGNFKDTFSAISFMEEQGLDVEEIFRRIALAPEEAINKIKEMSSALDDAIARSAELETKLEAAESGSDVRHLRDQIADKDYEIKRLENEIADYVGKAEDEFNAFLSANEIPLSDTRVRNILYDVESGALSAKEAIASLKGSCMDLFNSTEITSGFGEDGLTRVLQNIEEIMYSIEELRTQMNSIRSGDFTGSDSFSPLADGADEQIDKQADSLRRLGSATESVSGIKEILAPLMELMQGAGQEASSLSTFLTELATGFDKLNAVALKGGESFGNVTNALYSLSKLNGLKISPTPFKNLSEGLRNLSEGVGAGIDPSKLAALSSVNFSGFSNITVKKASLANLAEYLPVIAAVNPARLQKIGEVNLTNFNNIKVKSDAIQSIAQLAEAVSALKDNDIIQIARNYASAGEQMGSSAGAQADEMNKIINAASSAGNIKLDFSGDNIATVQRYLESLNIESTVANNMAKAFSGIEGKITSVSAVGSDAINKAGDVMKVVVKGVREGADGTIENIERVVEYAKKSNSEGGGYGIQTTSKATVKFGDAEAADLKNATDAFTRLAKVRNEIANIKSSMYKLDSGSQEYAVLNERLSQQVDLRKQIAQEVAAIAKQNPQIISQAQEESQYYEKISEGVSKAAQARAKYDDKVESSAKKTAASYKQVNEAIAKGQNILNSASSDQIGTQEYMAVQAGVNKLRALVGDQTQIDFEVNVEGAQKARTEIDNLMGAISKYKSEVASVGDTDFSTNIEKAKLSLQSIEQQMSAFRTDSGLSTEFDKLKADLDGIQNSADLSKWNTQVDLFIQKVRAADLAFRDTSMDMVSDDKVSSYLKKVTQMYERVQKAQDNWTKAKKGGAKDEYADLERQRKKLEQIMQVLQKASNTGGLKAGQFASIKNEVASLGAAFETVSRKVQEAGANTKSFGDRLKGLSSKFAWWLSASQLVMAGYNKIREGVQAIIEIDDALVDLQKTTDGTAETYKQFAKDANAAAKELGVTTQEYISMTAEWSRLGYNLQDSALMAKTSSIFAAISPEMDTSTATDGLISIMKAYKVEAEDALDGVASKINVLGNSFAVNNNDLTEAMMRSASALSAGRNSLEESLSLTTAATEVVRDADMVGNALKTISLRIRGLDEDSGELSDDLTTITGDIADLTRTASNPTGISLFEPGDPNTYKSTYDFLQDISEIWDELTDKNQAQLLEKLFGKNRANVGAAILSNFETAQKAMVSMENSAGSAEEEMALVEDTLTFKLNALGQTWVNVAQNIIDTDLVKGAVDSLTALSGVISDITGALGAIGTGGVAIGLIDLFKSAPKINEIGRVSQEIQKITGDLNAGKLVQYIDALNGLTTGQRNTVLGTSTLFGRRGSGINDAAAQVSDIIDSVSKLNNMSLRDIASEFERLGVSEDNIMSFLDAMGGDPDSTLSLDSLTDALSGDNAQEAFGSIRDALDDYRQRIGDAGEQTRSFSQRARGYFRSVGAGIKSYLKTPEGFMSAIGIVTSAIMTVYSLYKQHREQMITTAQEAGQSFNTMTESVDGYKERIRELKASMESGTLSQKEMYDARVELLSIQNELTSAYGDEIGQLNLLATSADNVAAAFDKMTAAQATANLNENATVVKDSVKKMDNSTFKINLNNIEEGALDNILGRYKDEGVTWDSDGGNLHIKISANARDAKETINSIQEDMKNAGYNTKGIQKSFEIVQKQASDIISEYGELYDNGVKWMVAADSGLSDLETKATDAAEKIGDAYTAQYDTDAERQKAIRDAINYADTVQSEINSIDLTPDQEPARNYISNILGDVDGLKGLAQFESDLAAGNKEIMNSITALDAFMNESGGVSGYDILSFGEEYKAMSGDVADGSSEQAAAWENLTALAEKYGITVEDALNIVASKADSVGTIKISFEVEAGAYDAQTYFDNLSSRTTTLTGKYTALTEAMNEQRQNGTLSIETFQALSESIDGVSECLEYNADGMVVNEEKLRDLVDAKKEDIKKSIEQQKKDDVKRFERNAKQIARLENAYDSLTDAQKEELKLLKSENDTISENVNSYNILTQEIDRATSAYQAWLDAQSSSDIDQMYNDAFTAFEQIQDLLKAGDVGGNKYKAAVEFLIPESEQDKVSSYLSGTLDKFFTSDDNTGIINFMNAMISNGFIRINEELGKYEVLKNFSVEDVAAAMNLTVDAAQALLDYANYKGAGIEFEGDIFNGGDITANAEAEVKSLQEEIDIATAKRDDLLDPGKWTSVDKSLFSSDEIDEIEAARDRLITARDAYNDFAADELDSNASQAQVDAYNAQLEVLKQAADNAKVAYEGVVLETEYCKSLTDSITANQENISSFGDSSSTVYTLISQFRELNTLKKKILSGEVGEDAASDYGGLTGLQDEITATQNKLSALGNDIKEHFYIDDSLFSSGIASVKELFNTYADAITSLKEMKAAGASTEDIDIQQKKVDALRTNITDLAKNVPDIETKLNIDLSDFDELDSQILEGNFSPTYTLNIGVGEAQDAIQTMTVEADNLGDAIEEAAKKRFGNFGLNKTLDWTKKVIDKVKSLNNTDLKNKNAVYTVKYVSVFQDGTTSTTTTASGSKITGSAEKVTNLINLNKGPLKDGLAYGTMNAHGGKSLVGELGRELIVSDGHYYTVGEKGAEFVNLKHGDIVFNHNDTEKILSGKSGVRGTALAYGNAYPGGTAKTGTAGNVITTYQGEDSSVKQKEKEAEEAKKAAEQAKQEAYNKQKDFYDNRINNYEYQIEQMQRSGASGESIANVYRSMMSNTQGYANTLRKMGYSDTSDEIIALKKQYYEYAEKAVEAIIEGYESAIEGLQNKISLNELIVDNAAKKGDLDRVQSLTAEMASYYKEMQKTVHDEAQFYRSKGYAETSEEISTLQQKWWEYYNSMSEIVAAAYDKIVSSLENQVSMGKFWTSNALDQKDLKGAQKYADGVAETLREAQKQIHDEAEYYRSLGYSDTSDEVSALSQKWWEYADEIKEVNQSVVDYVINMAEEASDALDSLQGSIDTLKAAADEYAQSGGYLSVDTFQDILNMGPQYLRYLEDENGQLVINREVLNGVIAAKAKDLAVTTALSYVERVKAAAEGKSNETLDDLTGATISATNATWGLVYATAASINLTKSQEQAMLHNIDVYRALGENAANSALLGISDSVSEMRDGMSSILEYTMDMLADRLEQQKEALEEMKTSYAEIIDAKKESLKLTKEENSYQKTVKQKLKEIAKIQAQIEALSLDDSRSAQAEKAKLLEDLADLQDDLSETQADKAYETQVDSLDKMQKAYEDEKDAEIKALEESASSYEKRYQQAIEYIDNNWNNLYNELIQWNYNYGSSLERDVTGAWENATRALQTYGGTFSSVMEQLNSAEGTSSVIGTTSFTEESNDAVAASIAKQMYANSVAWHNSSKAEQDNLRDQNERLANQIESLTGKSVTKTADGAYWMIDGEKLYDKYNVYHSGGIVGYTGDVKQNEQFALLESGEWVLNKDMVKNLTDQIDMLSRIGNSLSVGSASMTFAGFSRVGALDTSGPISNVNSDNRSVSITFGDTTIHGADNSTVQKHLEVNRDTVNQIAKVLGVKM